MIALAKKFSRLYRPTYASPDSPAVSRWKAAIVFLARQRRGSWPIMSGSTEMTAYGSKATTHVKMETYSFWIPIAISA